MSAPRSEAEIFAVSDADRARLEGRDVVVSTSGGKDSAAVALLLERAGIPFRAVMMDTGWEHPATLDYVRDVLAPRFGGVEVIASEGMPALVRRKGVFPSNRMRFCTEALKVEPFKAWIATQRARDPQACAVNVLGIRRFESKKRADAKRWSTNGALGVDVWRPLVEHSFDDVIEMHRIAGLEPNPLYLRGATRVGCFPCIQARKGEIAMVARLWPERIAEIRHLEAELTAGWVERMRLDGKAQRRQLMAVIKVAYEVAGGRHAVGMPSFGDWRKHFTDGGVLDAQLAARQAALVAAIDAGEYADQLAAELRRVKTRTFFHGSSIGSEPIDAVVEWATGFGQLDLLRPADVEGCARWGLCEGAGQ